VLVAVACCPHPPLLVPQVAQGVAPRLDPLRTACDDAVAELLAAAPDIVVVLGSAPQPGAWPGDAGGSLRPYGVDLRTGGAGPDGLPLALAVGAWLLDRAGWTGRRAYVAATAEADASEPLGAHKGREAVLCMADGSAKRSTGAPGHLDERAAGHDARVATALRIGDAAALAGLDLDLAAQLWAGGVPAWRALGQLLLGPDRPRGSPRTSLLHHEAPFGVGYLVATWRWDGVVGAPTDG